MFLLSSLIVNPSSEVASDLPVEVSQSSESSEEKPATDELGSKQTESVKKDVVSEKADEINVDVSEATKEATGEDPSSTDSKNTESQTPVKSEALKTESKASTLSAFAVEFVPRAAYNLQLAVNTPEFVPTSFSQPNYRPPLLRQQSSTPENELMNCVKDVLFGSTQSPGELDSYVNTLVKMLKKKLSSLDSLKEVVDLIFEYVGIVSECLLLVLNLIID